MKKAMKMFTGIAMAATMMFSGFAGFAGHDCHEDCCCDLCMTASAAPAHTCGQYVYDSTEPCLVWAKTGKGYAIWENRPCRKCHVCHKVVSWK